MPNPTDSLGVLLQTQGEAVSQIQNDGTSAAHLGRDADDPARLDFELPRPAVGVDRRLHRDARGTRVTSSYLSRWLFYVISCAFFAVVLYALLVEWPQSAAAAGTGEIFGTLRALTVVLWLGYPIIWAVGVEGFALVQSVGLTSWAYSALDVLAKYVFSFLLLRWVAANESVVSNSGVGSFADD